MIKPEKILILTSEDMSDNRAEAIKDYVEKNYKHYKVIKIAEKDFAVKPLVNLRDKIYNYGVQKSTFVYNFYDRVRRNCGKIGNLIRKGTDYKKTKKSTGRFRKIYNICLRFNPNAIICFSNFALFYAVKAKNKFGLNCDIVMFPNTFTLDKNGMLLKADKYIVENNDFKNELIDNGISNEKIFVKKLPVKVPKEEPQSVEACKAQFDLDEKPAIMLTASKIGSNKIIEVFNLLIDQGDEFNFAIYCGENESLYRKLDKIKEQKNIENIKIFTTLNNFETLFNAMDFILSVYDIETIYNGFIMQKPMVLFAPKNESEEDDLEYLDKANLCLYAKNSADVIVKMFELLNNDNSAKLENIKLRAVEKGTANTCALFIKIAAEKKEA